MACGREWGLCKMLNVHQVKSIFLRMGIQIHGFFNRLFFNLRILISIFHS